MSWKSLGGLFKERKNTSELLTAGDRKIRVEAWLQDRLRTSQVRCERVAEEQVIVRTNSSVLKQEVRLLEYDLKEFIAQELGLEVKDVKVLS